jgi:hypothetical protein
VVSKKQRWVLKKIDLMMCAAAAVCIYVYVKSCEELDQSIVVLSRGRT